MPTSASRLLFKNNAGQILAEPAGFLRTIWSTQPRTLADTSGLFTHMGLNLKRHNWSRILIDQQGMPPFSTAEQQWVAHEWLQQAVRECGYRHGAVLVSPDVFVRLATAYITTNVQGLPLIYRSFDVEADALQWLLRQPMSPVG